MIGIYKITNPSGKVYIGQSIDIEKRFKGYKSEKCTAYTNQIRLKNSMLKHGWENHIFEVVCECEIGDLNKLERKYQDEYNVVGPQGLNCLLTKTDELPHIFSLESRKKMGRRGKDHHYFGKKFSPEFVAEMSRVRKGKPSGREGTKHTEATKKLMSEAAKKRIASEETRAKISKGLTGTHLKKCYLISKEGTIIHFDGICHAVEYCKKNGYPKAAASKISLVCNGKRKKAYGFLWAFHIT